MLRKLCKKLAVLDVRLPLSNHDLVELDVRDRCEEASASAHCRHHHLKRWHRASFQICRTRPLPGFIFTWLGSSFARWRASLRLDTPFGFASASTIVLVLAWPGSSRRGLADSLRIRHALSPSHGLSFLNVRSASACAFRQLYVRLFHQSSAFERHRAGRCSHSMAWRCICTEMRICFSASSRFDSWRWLGTDTRLASAS